MSDKKMTAKEQQRFHDKKVKMLHKAFCDMLENIGYNNELIENICVFVKNEPQVFATGRDPENRNFLKWALNENIKRNKQLLSQISRTEKKLNLPLENPETPSD